MRDGNGINQVQANLIGQLRHFGVRGLTLVAWNETSIKVSKKTAGAIIDYDRISDLYGVSYYKDFDIQERIDGVFADQLGAVIDRVRTAR